MFSGSQDQSIRVWDWNIIEGTTSCLQIGRGHERSVECLSVSPDSTRFATGGWDAMLKIWSSGKNHLFFGVFDGVYIKKDHCEHGQILNLFVHLIFTIRSKL